MKAQSNWITGAADPVSSHKDLIRELLEEVITMSPDVETQNRILNGRLVDRILVMQGCSDELFLGRVERAVRETFPAPDTIARCVRELRANGLKPSPYWTYSEYLNSAKWRQRRQAYLNSMATKRCEMCSKEGPLDVHHNNYANIGCELDEDLIALCWKCHAKHHDKLPT